MKIGAQRSCKIIENRSRGRRRARFFILWGVRWRPFWAFFRAAASRAKICKILISGTCCEKAFLGESKPRSFFLASLAAYAPTEAVGLNSGFRDIYIHMNIRWPFAGRRVGVCALPFFYRFTQCRSPARLYLDPATPTLPSSATHGLQDSQVLWILGFSDPLLKRKNLIGRDEGDLASFEFVLNVIIWMDILHSLYL